MKPAAQPAKITREEPAPLPAGGRGIDSFYQEGTDRVLDYQVKRQP